jgi:dihydropteroate synthase
MRSAFQWNLGTRTLQLGQRTLIMGVVNVTPDSFYDGGLYFDRDKAVAHAARLINEGADIIDIGGESTRPGAHVAVKNEPNPAIATASPAVRAEQETQRVIPVISKLKKQFPGSVISVDTYKSVVARAAVDAGAEIVNDVSGFRWDSEMISTLAGLRCGAVLMHMRGTPDQWRTLPPPGDVVELVKSELSRWAEAAVNAGVRRDRIVLDPGLGFGKRLEENYPLFAHFDKFDALGFPLLAGVSRKSFIGRMLAQNGKDASPEARLYGTLAAQVGLILKGVHIIRTHDVRPAAEAARVADIILRSQ